MDKKSIIDKFVYLLKTNKTTVKFVKEEKDYLVDGIHLFSYLISYQLDKNNKLDDRMSRNNKEKEFYLYSINTDDKYCPDNKIPGFSEFVSDKNKDHFEKGYHLRDNSFDIIYVYEKQESIIKKYLRIVPPDEIYVNTYKNHEKHTCNTIRVPAICGDALTKVLLDSKQVVQVNDNEYHLLLYRYKNPPPFIKKKFKNSFVTYLMIDNKLVEKSCFERGEYENYKELKERYTGFMVIDENGIKFDNTNYSSNVILYYLRACVAGHSESYNYQLKSGCYNGGGKIFLTNEKSINETENCKRAVVIDDNLISILHLFVGATGSFVCDTASYAYLPKLKSKDKFIEYLKNCYFYSIDFLQNNEEKNLLISLIYKIQNEMSNSNICFNSSEEFEEYYHDLFKNYKIKKESFENLELVSNLIESNDRLDKSNCQIIREYLKFLCSCFYEKSIFTDSKRLQKLGDSKSIRIKSDGLVLVSQQIVHKIYGENQIECIGEYNNYLNIVDYQTRETMIWLCLFLAYMNLVQNKLELNISNDIDINILDNIDFSKFFVIYADKTCSNSKTFDTKDKKEIIRAIRNAVCHSNFYIELSKSGDWEQCKLCFYNINKMVAKITISDFLEFISSEQFSNYGELQDVICSDLNSLYSSVKDLIKSEK